MKFILLRISAPLIIIILAFLAFRNGVVVQYRPDLGQQTTGILVFHIVSFFTFGARDYGPPVGGPLFWQYVLYFIYYAAPIISLSAIAETFYLLSKPFLPLLLYRKEHHLIIGYGRVGKATADFIKAEHIDSRIVVLDKNELQSPQGFNLLRWKLLFLQRDMTDENALDDLRFENCKAVFIVLDDEWLNLRLFFAIRKQYKFSNKPIYVRISSGELLTYLHKKETENRANQLNYFFNVHTAACGQLFDDKIINEQLKWEYEQFQKWISGKVETMIFFTFGRFSRALLEMTLHHGSILSSLKKIIIVDPQVKVAWAEYRLNNPEPAVKVDLIEECMENILLYKYSFDKKDTENALCVFGNGRDELNIRSATIFHKNIDPENKIHYILRTRHKNNYPDEVLKTFVGENYINIPTYDWIRAYYEDKVKYPNQS